MKCLCRYIALLCLAWFAVGAADAAVIYVNASATGYQDGATWASAYTSIGAAAQAAHATDEVWVAAGTYMENIALPPGVALYGGFAGSETLRSERNWAAQATAIQGVSGPVIDVENGAPSDVAVVDGFTLRNGTSNSFNGGGVYVSSASVALEHDVIRNNQAFGTGGGVYVTNGSLTVRDCLITANTASDGGAITGAASTLVVANSTLADNTASRYGGGIALVGYNISASITNTIIAYNSSGLYAASGSGAGVALQNTDVYGNGSSNFNGVADPGSANGNLSSDPQFTGRAAGDYTLAASSPAVDAGSDTAVGAGDLDLAHAAREQGSHADLGAYEAAFVSVPTALLFATQPGNGRAGVPLSPQPVVKVLDQKGSFVPWSGSILLSLQGAGMLTGTTTLNVSDGIAAFTDVGVVQAGSAYRLTASAQGLNPATSDPFDISPVATKLAFAVQPAGAQPYLGFLTQPKVVALLSDGTVDSGFTGPIAVQIRPDTGNRLALFGLTTVDAVGGASQFSGLGIAVAGSGYVLRATSGTLTPADSAPFNVQEIAVKVRPDGNDGNDGKTWATAKQTIQAAINAAPSGTRVWVAAGTYNGGIILHDGVTVCGGFAGTETATSQRNVAANITTIDAQNQGNDAIFYNGVTATLDGFTLLNGRAAAGFEGGNVYVGSATAAIANCSLQGGAAPNYGGGIYVLNSTVTISNNTITGGNGWNNGGGVYAETSTVTLTNNMIQQCAAMSGGGAWLVECTATVSGNTISNNSTMGLYGGGLALSWPHDGTVVSGNIITNNTSDDNGGGIFVASNSPDKFQIVSNLVAGNTAGRTAGSNAGGSGLYLWSGAAYPLVANNTFVQNSGGQDSVRDQLSNADFVNNIVAFNTSGGIRYNPSYKSVFNNHNNCVYGNSNFDYIGASPGPNDITADPGFVATGTDYHLSAVSPCRDTGDSTVVASGATDLSGRPRIVGSSVDMGAYEWYPPPAVRLAFFWQPSGGHPGQPLPTQPVVVAQAVDGSRDITYTGGVTLTLVKPAGSTAVLSGTTTVSMVAGVATFTGLSVDQLGAGYTLHAASNPLTPADSQPFDITEVSIHVKPTGDDGNDGLTWDRAKKTVGAAITAASGSGAPVWVAAGTYNERITLASDNKGVSLYGGFAGMEALRSQRNPAANPTILDGGQGGPVIRVYSGVDASTVVDGFTIRNGSGEVQAPDVTYGGGIVIRNAAPTITNNIITGNTATLGGGIYSDGGSATGSNPLIQGNVIQGNTARRGAGIFTYMCNPDIRANEIAHNTAEQIGGGMEVAGNGADNYTFIIRNRIHDNNGGAYGGGIVLDGIGATVLNNLFAGNSASKCGGVSIGSPGNVYVVNNTFANNSASTAGSTGGALSLDGTGTTALSNNIVAYNSSGISIAAGAPAPTLSHDIVYANGADDYSGLTAGATDIAQAPGFVSAMDYHLAPGSPGINGGDPGTITTAELDLDGNPRVQGGCIDIGAYESSIAAGYTLTDAATALKIAAGLTAATADLVTRLNVEDTAAGEVNLRDATRIARKVAGIN